MPSSEHDRLVGMAVRWLRKRGFPIATGELVFSGKGEQPDAIVFCSNSTAIVEVKISRSDFQADSKKPWRSGRPSLCVYRYYLCPEGLIKPEELPKGWGLLYANKRSISLVDGYAGNIWSPYPSKWESDRPWQHVPDLDDERRALYSIARRLMSSKGLSVQGTEQTGGTFGSSNINQHAALPCN